MANDNETRGTADAAESQAAHPSEPTTTPITPFQALKLVDVQRYLLARPKHPDTTPLVRLGQTAGVFAKREQDQDRKLAREIEHGLHGVLGDFYWGLPEVTREFAQKMGLQPLLDAIKNKPDVFSQASRDYANALSVRYATYLGPTTGPTEETEGVTSLKRRATSPSARKQKDDKRQSITGADQGTNGDYKDKVLKESKTHTIRDLNNPLFQHDGPYPGCEIVYRTDTKRAVIRGVRGHRRQNAKKRGHNGLRVNDWFPSQTSLWACGGHGSVQAGIFGDGKTGAYSIITTQTYAGVEGGTGQNTDTLEDFEYCATGSLENTSPKELVMSPGLRALEGSKKYAYPVRVFRGRGSCVGAPSAGIRYDGLYKVVDESPRTNKKGGRMIMFRMERVEGQPAIDLARPTVAEAARIRETERTLQDVKNRFE